MLACHAYTCEYIEWEWYPYIRNLTLPAFDHITLYISVFYFYIVQERERERTHAMEKTVTYQVF